MIFDSLQHADTYAPLHPLLAEAFAALRSLDAQTPAGRIELRGQDLFINVERYTTKPTEQQRYESHRTHLDIQTIFTGEEAIDVAATSSLSVTDTYDPDRDVAFYAPIDGLRLPLHPGLFAIFLPQDAHRPVCQLAGPSEVVKAVAKVRLH